jgi:hypothetical protein
MLHVAEGQLEGRMGVRCTPGLALIVSGAAAMALLGCSQTLSLVELPNLSKLPSKLLSKEQQAKTMNQMLEKGQTHQAEAAKEIEAVNIETTKEADKAK